MVLDRVLGSTGLEGPLRYCRIVYTGARFRPKVPELLDGLPQSAGFEGLGFRRFRRFPRYWKVLGVGGVDAKPTRKWKTPCCWGCHLIFFLPPQQHQNVMGLCPL